jgi:hypothetical protein
MRVASKSNFKSGGINPFGGTKKEDSSLKAVGTFSNAGRTLVPLLWFCVTFAVAGIFAPYLPDAHHDGAVFKPSLDVANGMMLYKDTFSQYGPLYILILAGAIKLFGAYVLVIRMVGAFFYGLIGAMLWLVSARLLPRWLANLVCVLWLSVAGYFGAKLLPWSSIPALFFQLASLWVFIMGVHSKISPSKLFLAGLLAGLSTLCRQPTGISLLLAETFFLLFYDWNRSYSSLSKWGSMRIKYASCVQWPWKGFVVGVLPVFSWIIFNGALNDWYIQNVKFAKGFSALFCSLSSPVYVIKHLFPFGDIGAYQHGSFLYGLLPILSIAGFVWFMVRLFRCKALQEHEQNAFAVILCALTSWLQYLPFPDDVYHAYWAATPMIPVSVYLFWKLLNSQYFQGWFPHRAWAPALVTLVMIGVFFKTAQFQLEQAWSKLHGGFGEMIEIQYPSVVQGMKTTRDVAERYQAIGNSIDQYLEINPGATVISSHPDALWITFTSRAKNFHPLYMNWIKRTTDWGTKKSLMNEIYPDYQNTFMHYAATQHPLILALDGVGISNYHIFYRNAPTNGESPITPVVFLAPD